METTLNENPRLHLSDNSKRIIVDVIIYLFVALFVYTAESKFMTMKSFESILSRSPLTAPFSIIIAWAVPIIEILISILLLIPNCKKLGLIFSLTLMSLFTVFLTYGIVSGSKLPCHCGGLISSMTWQQHIWLNIGFIILAIIGLKLYKKEQKILRA